MIRFLKNKCTIFVNIFFAMSTMMWSDQVDQKGCPIRKSIYKGVVQDCIYKINPQGLCHASQPYCPTVPPLKASEIAKQNKQEEINAQKAIEANKERKKQFLITFHKRILELHNEYRAKSGAPPMVYNQKISEYAQEWADKLGAENRMYHRGAKQYGENIWYGSGQATADKAFWGWYAEIGGSKCKEGENGLINKCGHFTQIVWKGSTELGCGIAMGSVVVCNYFPPGNVIGYEKNNVFFPKK